MSDEPTFRINRVYTRSGDTGYTGLVGGSRVSKCDVRVRAYGDVDELNSFLGLVKEKLGEHGPMLAPIIVLIQQELFDLGSELATAKGQEYPGMWKAEQRHIQALEALCDRFNDPLPELRSFILPGGTELAALLHISRTVARRAERSVVELSESIAAQPGTAANGFTLQFLNRLSDLLFILARWVLHADNITPPLWEKESARLSNQPL